MKKRKILIASTLISSSMFLVSCGGGIDYDISTQTLTIIRNEIKLNDLKKNTSADQLDAQAKQYTSSGEARKANSRYQKIVTEHPYSTKAPEAQFRIAEYLEAKGKRSKAFDAYQALITTYLGTPLYQTALDRQLAIAHDSYTGKFKSNVLFLKTAVPNDRIDEMLEQVISNAPHAPSAPQSLYLRGELRERQKNLTSAVSIYRSLTKNYPESNYSGEALFRIGSILYTQAQKGDTNLDNSKLALQTFEELKQLYPRHAKIPEANVMMGQIRGYDVQRSLEVAEFYEQKGQTASAIFYYKEILASAPKGSELHKIAQSKVTALTSTVNN